MIIVKILGGLGNQLFQYAAARALAVHHSAEVKLDVSGFENDSLRHFELGSFHFPFSYATAEEINSLKAATSLDRIKARLTPYPKKKFYKQPSFSFDPHFLKLGSSVYLQGYFQSENYFSSIAGAIRKEAVQSGISATAFQLAEEVSRSSSVAVHIRRGDYKDAKSLTVHGILPVTYYQRAVAFIKKELASPRFYIFTDDPELDLREWDLPEATLVSGIHSNNHFEDLYLMSRCQHNIIANSSFGWWAAWLNQNPDKIIIAPKNWFNNGPKDTQDLLPPNWIQL